MSTFGLQRLRSREELVSVGKEIAGEIRSDGVPVLAAAVAFKIVLALFPSLVAGIGIFALVTDPGQLEELLDSLAGVAPADAVEFLREPLDRLIRGRAAGLAAVVGIGGGLWAASGAAVTLNQALTRAYDMVDERKLVKARVVALAVTAALLLALIGIFVLRVAGGVNEDNVLASLPLTDSARGFFDVVSMIARYLLAAVALMLLFAFIYWIGPDYDERPRYPWISPGAVVGVVTWLVASALFSVYANTFGSYDAGSVYGPLGSAVLFMLWLQLTMLAVLLGAEVNQTLRLRASRRTQEAEVAGFGGEPAVDLASMRQTPAGGGATPTAGAAAPERDTASATDRSGAGAASVAAQRPADRGAAGTGRAVDVRDHTAGIERHGRRSKVVSARNRSTATVVAAALAGLSSVVGLIGLLRNRRRF